MKKVLFITNYASPYRVCFYDELAKYMDVTVLFSDRIEDKKHRSADWFISGEGRFKAVQLEKRVGSTGGRDLCLDVTKWVKQDFDAINTAAKEHRELFLNGDKFIIRPFKDWFDILKESREQKHAVAAFAKNRYGIGLDYLFAMRKADDPETPYITLEFLPDGRLSQCRKQHCKPVTDADELAFVEEFRTKILLPYIEENA